MKNVLFSIAGLVVVAAACGDEVSSTGNNPTGGGGDQSTYVTSSETATTGEGAGPPLDGKWCGPTIAFTVAPDFTALQIDSVEFDACTMDDCTDDSPFECGAECQAQINGQNFAEPISGCTGTFSGATASQGSCVITSKKCGCPRIAKFKAKPGSDCKSGTTASSSASGMGGDGGAGGEGVGGSTTSDTSAATTGGNN